jgi:peptide chain release factor
MITLEKWQQLRERMTKENIREADLVEQFILGSGKGGQKLQKTSSCVRLHHSPSGIIIKESTSRQRDTNRYRARQKLCDKIENIRLGEKSREKKQQEKIRRQKTKRSKRAKEKILKAKHYQANKKKLRKTPKDDTP